MLRASSPTRQEESHVRSKAALASTLVVTFGLTGISTAGAATGNPSPPSAPSGPKGCEIKMQNSDGSSYNVCYDHGKTDTLKGSDGNKVTKKCNNGTWVSRKLSGAGGAPANSPGPTVARR